MYKTYMLTRSLKRILISYIILLRIYQRSFLHKYFESFIFLMGGIFKPTQRIKFTMSWKKKKKIKLKLKNSEFEKLSEFAEYNLVDSHKVFPGWNLSLKMRTHSIKRRTHSTIHMHWTGPKTYTEMQDYHRQHFCLVVKNNPMFFIHMHWMGPENMHRNVFHLFRPEKFNSAVRNPHACRHNGGPNNSPLKLLNTIVLWCCSALLNSSMP